MRRLAKFPILAAALALAPVSALAELSGPATVIDGDTIEVDQERVRLHGIDAPERAQSCGVENNSWPCGRDAGRALAKRIAGQRVLCEEKARDRYGRSVAVCRIKGHDLGAWMVSQGWALAYRRYSNDYADEEAEAKSARKGVWRGEFTPPWEWRRQRRD